MIRAIFAWVRSSGPWLDGSRLEASWRRGAPDGIRRAGLRSSPRPTIMPATMHDPDAAPSPPSPPEEFHPVRAVRRALRQHRSAPLLAVLTLLDFVYPAVRDSPTKLVGALAIYLLLLFTGIVAIARRRRAIVGGVLASIPMLVAVALAAEGSVFDRAHGGLIVTLASVPFTGYMALQLLTYISRPGRHFDDRLIGAAAAYLLGAEFWAGVFSALVLLDPGSIAQAGVAVQSADELKYFSFVTLTTLGYGDIVPVSREARALASFEAVSGVFFLAFLVSRLMVLHAPKP